MKRLSSADYARIIFQAYHDAKPAARPNIVANFIQLLRRHRAMKLWPRIISHLQRLTDQVDKVTRVRVTIPQAALETKLQAALKQAVGPITMDTTIDSTILGGAIIRLGDQEIDGSIRSKLNQLRTHLIKQ